MHHFRKTVNPTTHTSKLFFFLGKTVMACWQSLKPLFWQVLPNTSHNDYMSRRLLNVWDASAHISIYYTLDRSPWTPTKVVWVSKVHRNTFTSTFSAVIGSSVMDVCTVKVNFFSKRKIVLYTTHWYGRWLQHKTCRRTSWLQDPSDPEWCKAKDGAHCFWRMHPSSPTKPPWLQGSPALWLYVNHMVQLQWSDTEKPNPQRIKTKSSSHIKTQSILNKIRTLKVWELVTKTLSYAPGKLSYLGVGTGPSFFVFFVAGALV